MAPGLEQWAPGKADSRISRSSLRLFPGRDCRSATQRGEGGRKNWRKNSRAELRRAAESGAVRLQSAASHRFPECGPQSEKPARALSVREIELAARPARGSRWVRCLLRPCSSRPHWPRLYPLRVVSCRCWPRSAIRFRLGREPMLEPRMLEPRMLESMRCPMRLRPGRGLPESRMRRLRPGARFRRLAGLRLGRMQSARLRPAWH